MDGKTLCIPTALRDAYTYIDNMIAKKHQSYVVEIAVNNK
jgi:hypothetical protein